MTLWQPNTRAVGKQSPDRLPTKREIRPPRFLWQGLLIVFPAVVLAGVGFLSLRQDRILAEHEAAEQARKIAANVALTLLPEAVQREFPTAAAVNRFRHAPGRPDDDPVFATLQRAGRPVVFLVDAQGSLLYPPPIVSWPSPEPLDIDLLPPDQQSAWETAQGVFRGDTDAAKAMVVIQGFLTSSPPAPFAAAALYQLGRLHQSQGDPSQARPYFEAVAEQYPAVTGESGYPWKVFAELSLFELATAAFTTDDRLTALIASLCSYAILDPSPLSPRLLDTMITMNPRWKTTVAEWQQVRIAHDTARRFHSYWQDYWQDARADSSNQPRAPRQPVWLKSLAGQDWLAIPQSQGLNRWMLALSEDAAVNLARQAVATVVLPAYLGLDIEIAGKTLAQSPDSATILASSPDRVNASTPLPGLRVNVVLRDPQALFARQRMRTLWFGSLIALATGAVFIGFLTARRAFLRQQQLSEMKSNFVSSVSHELRSPIASVRLMAEELEDLGSRDLEKNREYHHFIVQECRRLSALIENVLDFSRHEQGRKQYEFEPTDMAALVQETARLMRTYAADHRISIATCIRGEPAPIEVDGRSLQQVLVNLLDNAIKHSPDEATVTIGLEFPTREDGEAPPSATQPAHAMPSDPPPLAANRSSIPATHSARLILWVEDHGAGIPPEEHERIFERFYRCGSELRRETQGVGLGLAIVKYVTEAHGGRVTVRSAVGQGSRFTVELPIRTPDSRIGAAASR